MRSLFLFSIIIAGMFVTERSSGQSNQPAIPEKPGVILVRVSGTLDAALSAAFSATRPAGDIAFAHSDINEAVLGGDSTIRTLLGLPSAFHGLHLRPFIPTHSVAFEDIRERSNPQLFQHGDVIQSGNQTANIAALRISEDKISHWFLLSFSDSIYGDRAVALTRKSSLIQLAEPKFIRQAFNTPDSAYAPNDPDLNQQYSLLLMNVFQAWGIVRCDSTMILADADIGTDWTHQDLNASIFLNQGEIGIDAHGVQKQSNGIDDDSDGFIDDWHGWDFGGTYGTKPDNDARPGSNINHGTQTAGIFGATGNNATGIAGVAFGARVIPIKISDDYGNNLDFGFQGIMYAADMRAKLVNCSWGGAGQSGAEQDVVDYAYAKDCAVVAAAGNYGDSNPFQDIYPAAYNHVLSVAAVDENGDNASFSNFNTHVDIAAPGVGIMSTIPENGYLSDPNEASGTSFASPNTAGVVALVRQRFPYLTAGQAMEQVRVTGDSLLGLDPVRNYYEGHGEVDALRAVTDTNTFSARVDSVTFDDQNRTGSFAPGESGGIVIHALNYLKPLQQLMARAEVVSGGGYVRLHQSIIPFGPVGTLQAISNDPAAFQITVADNVPPNTEILIRVFFFDTLSGYAEDYDYIRFVIEPSYLDLNANNLSVTFSSIGSLGYNDVLNNSEGSGLFWRTAPASISPFGKQLIYEAGLMVGTDSNHVVDVVQGDDGNSPDFDLTSNEIIHYVDPPDHSNAAQELTYSLTDSLADPSIQIGLHATCKAYAFTQGLAANAVIVKYTFSGEPGSAFAATDNAAAAFFLDWDVGPSGALNYTRFDSATATAISYRLDQGYPYLGMKLISPLPPGASFNYHAVLNDGSQGDINTYGPFLKPAKWLSMNEFYDSVGPGDIAHTFGLKNMPIHSQGLVEMTFVIALAENPALLTQTIAEAQSIGDADTIWFEEGVSPQPVTAPSALEVFPNPFHNVLHVSWDATGPAHVMVYDALGRTILSKDVSASQFDFAPTGIPSGFYTIDVAIGGTHLRRHVVASE